jgi:hypothetical protein
LLEDANAVCALHTATSLAASLASSMASASAPSSGSEALAARRASRALSSAVALAGELPRSSPEAQGVSSVDLLAFVEGLDSAGDAAVADKERRAREVFERTVAAREGAVIDVPRAKKRAP